MDQTHTLEIAGERYATVTLGDQIWLADNLRADRLPDGSAIVGAYVYAEDEGRVRDYGRLYTFAALVELAALCPAPWRVPTDADWQRLEGYLGLSVAEQQALGWRGEGRDAALVHRGALSPRQRRALGRAAEPPFAALPAGARAPDGGYRGLHDYAELWTSTPAPEGRAYSRALVWIASHPGRSKIFRGQTHADWALSVRLVRDR